MAFFAIVALCVSPAFAWSCCCNAEQTVAMSATSSAKSSSPKLASARHCALPCCEKAESDAPTVMKAPASQSVHSMGHGAVVKSKCDCSHDDGSSLVSAVSSAQSFVGIGALAMPVQAFTLSFEEDARFAPCFDVAARPRSPGGRSSSGRGPPVFSS
ncbi:hypothetical protein EON83_07495 [bacterium]|nr:MAG: hypothetical protein EON83_07495 [bacterium]